MQIKICGLTRVEEAVATAEAGADWIGLNFHPPSPRFVDLAKAREIIKALPKRASPVGLFVDRLPSEVAKVADQIGLRIVQLHGNEPAEDLIELTHLSIVRAFRLDDVRSIESMRTYLRRAADLGRAPDAVLVDGYLPSMPGGTGTPIADDLLGQLPDLPRLILAGGLKPENVAERIRKARPWMVDVASGVESSPGRKDPEKVRAFVEAARSASY